MRNAIATSSFGMMAVGVWLLSPAWALVFIGTVLFTGAAVGHFREARQPTPRATPPIQTLDGGGMTQEESFVEKYRLMTRGDE